MFSKFFFAVLIYFFIEIYVFVEVSLRIGLFLAFFALILFSVIGYIITKRVKGITFQNAMDDYMNGRSPSRNIVKSVSYFISGVLFLVPGFVTDLIAVLFLIPFLNIYLVYLIFKYFKNKFKGTVYTNMGGFNNNSYRSYSEKSSSGFSYKSFIFTSLPSGKSKDAHENKNEEDVNYNDND